MVGVALTIKLGEIFLQLVHPLVYPLLVELVVLAYMLAVPGKMVLLEPAVGFANPAAMTWPLFCNVVSAIQKWRISSRESSVVLPLSN